LKKNRDVRDVGRQAALVKDIQHPCMSKTQGRYRDVGLNFFGEFEAGTYVKSPTKTDYG
jgi:hypothetical protein